MVEVVEKELVAREVFGVVEVVEENVLEMASVEAS